MRWSLLLGRYNLELLYRPGKQNVRADALLRREQDLPIGAEDERLQKRFVQIFKPTNSYQEVTEEEPEEAILVMATRTRSQQREEEAIPLSREESDQLLPRVLNEKVLEQNELEKLWQEATAKDRVYQGAKKAVED